MTVEELAAIQNAPTIRPEVAAFALAMEAKVRENDERKPHWRTMDAEELLSGLVRELAELVEAITYGDADDVQSEAADVANYAMMLADKQERLYLPPGVIALRIEEVRREVANG